MATRSRIPQTKLRQVLQSKLQLGAPCEFQLEVLPNGKLSGNVISDRFKGMTDLARQRAIWKALNDEFHALAVHYVGSLLAYTWDEWNVELEPVE